MQEAREQPAIDRGADEAKEGQHGDRAPARQGRHHALDDRLPDERDAGQCHSPSVRPGAVQARRLASATSRIRFTHWLTAVASAKPVTP